MRNSGPITLSTYKPKRRRSFSQILVSFLTGILLLLLIVATSIFFNFPETPLAAAPDLVNFSVGGSIARVPTALPSPTHRPHATAQQGAGQPTPQPTSAPTQAASALQDHYWFERPIPTGLRNYVSRFYPYGATYRGRYQVHHGVEFENPMGTPVLAVGSGEVVVAGPDDPEVYGRFPDFYGLLVVIRHDQTFQGQPVFTLYGHLSKVLVEVGQRVETGAIIGEVGASGVALGPHLHLEVRVGENNYQATRNPELWIRPFDGYGTIAGQLLDPTGEPLSQVLVALYDKNGKWRTETETYGPGVHADEAWQENFVFGDVPAGNYTVQYVHEDTIYRKKVIVHPGETTFVQLQLRPAEDD